MRNEDKIVLRRLLAFLIDYVIVWIPAIIFTTVAFTVSGFSSDIGLSLFIAIFMFIMPSNILRAVGLAGVLNSITLLMITVMSFSAAYSLYCLIMELTVGKTLGALCTKIKCVNSDLQRPNKKAILLRNFWKFISFACLFLGLIPALFGERKTLYDILSKTQVVMK